MTRTTSQLSSSQDTPVKPLDNEPFRQKVILYTSWACLISGPILIALPPRKLDIYTFGLLLCTFVGGNQVSREQTGISMIDRISHRIVQSTSALPPQALNLQNRAREERERGLQDLEVWRTNTPVTDTSGKTINLSTSSPSYGKSSREGLSFWKNIWMGGEGENWKEERLQRERDALSSGKGYLDLIQDQIRDVWNTEENKPEEKKDEVKELNKLNEKIEKIEKK